MNVDNLIASANFVYGAEKMERISNADLSNYLDGGCLGTPVNRMVQFLYRLRFIHRDNVEFQQVFEYNKELIERAAVIIGTTYVARQIDEMAMSVALFQYDQSNYSVLSDETHAQMAIATARNISVYISAGRAELFASAYHCVYALLQLCLAKYPRYKELGMEMAKTLNMYREQFEAVRQIEEGPHDD